MSGNEALPAWDRRMAQVLAVIAAAMPLVAVFAPPGIAVLGTMAGVAAVAVVRRPAPWCAFPREILATMALLMLWSVIGLSWALNVPQALLNLGRLTATVAAGAYIMGVVAGLSPASRLLVLRCLAASTLAMAVVLGVETATHSGVSVLVSKLFKHGRPLIGYKSPMSRGYVVVALLLWPAGLFVWRRWGWRRAAVLFVPAALLLLPAENLATRVSLLAGAGFLAAALRWPRAAFAALKVAVVALVLAAPFAAGKLPPPQETFQNWTWVPHSAHHRLTIWGFVAARIAEHPIRGWGMEASRDIPGADDEIPVERLSPSGVVISQLIETMLPLHPHNAVLQWWLELGGVGAIGLLAAMLLLLRRIERTEDPRVRAVWGATFVAALVVAAVSFGFWQSWWLCSLWLLAVFSLAAGRSPLPAG